MRKTAVYINKAHPRVVITPRARKARKAMNVFATFAVWHRHIVTYSSTNLLEDWPLPLALGPGWLSRSNLGAAGGDSILP